MSTDVRGKEHVSQRKRRRVYNLGKGSWGELMTFGGKMYMTESTERGRRRLIYVGQIQKTSGSKRGRWGVVVV